MNPTEQRQRDALQTLLTHLAEKLQAAVSIRLWDGTVVPLGDKADHELCISIKSPGVIASLLPQQERRAAFGFRPTPAGCGR